MGRDGDSKRKVDSNGLGRFEGNGLGGCGGAQGCGWVSARRRPSAPAGAGAEPSSATGRRARPTEPAQRLPLVASSCAARDAPRHMEQLAEVSASRVAPRWDGGTDAPCHQQHPIAGHRQSVGVAGAEGRARAGVNARAPTSHTWLPPAVLLLDRARSTANRPSTTAPRWWAGPTRKRLAKPTWVSPCSAPSQR